MSQVFDVAVLVGSLRKESFNHKIAKAAIQLAPPALKLRLVDLSHLQMYNQDFDEASPAEFVRFRDEIRTADALLFVTPEYNRSIPAVLKNALDVGSRPYGQSVWNGKPSAVISSSMGGIGGFGANHHLRQSLAFLNTPMMLQPEAYIGGAHQLFDETGALQKPETREFLERFMTSFSNWVATVLAARH